MLDPRTVLTMIFSVAVAFIIAYRLWMNRRLPRYEQIAYAVWYAGIAACIAFVCVHIGPSPKFEWEYSWRSGGRLIPSGPPWAMRAAFITPFLAKLTSMIIIRLGGKSCR